jgi:hypothetical protein
LEKFPRHSHAVYFSRLDDLGRDSAHRALKEDDIDAESGPDGIKEDDAQRIVAVRKKQRRFPAPQHLVYSGKRTAGIDHVFQQRRKNDGGNDARQEENEAVVFISLDLFIEEIRTDKGQRQLDEKIYGKKNHGVDKRAAQLRGGIPKTVEHNFEVSESPFCSFYRHVLKRH